MMLRRIGSCARISSLGGRPGLVLFVSAAGFVCTLCLGGVLTGLASALVMTLWIRVGGGLDPRDLWLGLGGPVLFAVAGALAACVSFGGATPTFDAVRFIALLARTTGAAACTMAAVLLVPVPVWLGLARRLGVPAVVTETASLMHGAILGMEESLAAAQLGVRARGPVEGWRAGIRTTAAVAGASGAQAFRTAAGRERARVSRNLIQLAACRRGREAGGLRELCVAAVLVAVLVAVVVLERRLG